MWNFVIYWHFNYNCRQTVSNPEEPLDEDSLNPSEDQKTLYLKPDNARQNKSNEEQQEKCSLEKIIYRDTLFMIFLLNSVHDVVPWMWQSR